MIFWVYCKCKQASKTAHASPDNRLSFLQETVHWLNEFTQASAQSTGNSCELLSMTTTTEVSEVPVPKMKHAHSN